MAADQGDAQAQYWLGRCYLTGYGTEVSEEEGKRWISAARAKGYDEDPDEFVSRTEEGEPRGAWEFSKEDAAADGLPQYGAPEPEPDDRPRSSVIGEVQPYQPAPRFDPEYLKTGLIFAAVGIVAGLVLSGIAALILALLSGEMCIRDSGRAGAPPGAAHMAAGL